MAPTPISAEAVPTIDTDPSAGTTAKYMRICEEVLDEHRHAAVLDTSRNDAGAFRVEEFFLLRAQPREGPPLPFRLSVLQDARFRRVGPLSSVRAVSIDFAPDDAFWEAVLPLLPNVTHVYTEDTGTLAVLRRDGLPWLVEHIVTHVYDNLTGAKRGPIALLNSLIFTFPATLPSRLPAAAAAAAADLPADLALQAQIEAERDGVQEETTELERSNEDSVRRIAQLEGALKERQGEALDANTALRSALQSDKLAAVKSLEGAAGRVASTNAELTDARDAAGALNFETQLKALAAKKTRLNMRVAGIKTPFANLRVLQLPVNFLEPKGAAEQLVKDFTPHSVLRVQLDPRNPTGEQVESALGFLGQRLRDMPPSFVPPPSVRAIVCYNSAASVEYEEHTTRRALTACLTTLESLRSVTLDIHELELDEEARKLLTGGHTITVEGIVEWKHGRGARVYTSRRIENHPRDTPKQSKYAYAFPAEARASIRMRCVEMASTVDTTWKIVGVYKKQPLGGQPHLAVPDTDGGAHIMAAETGAHIMAAETGAAVAAAAVAAIITGAGAPAVEDELRQFE